MQNLELVAHRGYAGKFPENTLAAVQGALDAGAHWIEIDVQLTQDGEVVLFHDRTLDRACGIAGTIHELTLSELRNCRVREQGRFGDQYRDEPIVTLREVAEVLRHHPDVRLFVEVKRVAIENHGLEFVSMNVLNALETIRDQIILISFSLELLQLVQGQAPLGYILEQWEDAARSELSALDPRYVFCNYTKVPKSAILTASWRWVLYEITDPKIARAFAARGVEMIETFEFEALQHALEEGPL